MNIVEDGDFVLYLKKRGLLKQYQKVKRFLLQDHTELAQLKKRAPKSSDIWYFRINQQYRAICKKKGDTLIVYAIDDHQNS